MAAFSYSLPNFAPPPTPPAAWEVAISYATNKSAAFPANSPPFPTEMGMEAQVNCETQALQLLPELGSQRDRIASPITFS